MIFRYSKEKVNGMPFLDPAILGQAMLELFNEEEIDIIKLIGDLQMYQIGEGPKPEGMDRAQGAMLLKSERVRQMTVRINEWYKKNGGKIDCLALPFLLEGEK